MAEKYRMRLNRNRATPSKVNWLAIKKDYLTDETATYEGLAKRYKVTGPAIGKMARREKWYELRKAIHKRAEERMLMKIEEEVSAAKTHHVKLGKLLQDKGESALMDGKNPVKIKQAKDVVAFIREGVNIERQAREMDKKEPKVVNIITQQNAMVDRYKKEGETLDDIEEGETGG